MPIIDPQCETIFMDYPPSPSSPGRGVACTVLKPGGTRGGQLGGPLATCQGARGRPLPSVADVEGIDMCTAHAISFFGIWKHKRFLVICVIFFLPLFIPGK